MWSSHVWVIGMSLFRTSTFVAASAMLQVAYSSTWLVLADTITTAWALLYIIARKTATQDARCRLTVTTFMAVCTARKLQTYVVMIIQRFISSFANSFSVYTEFLAAHLPSSVVVYKGLWVMDNVWGNIFFSWWCHCLLFSRKHVCHSNSQSFCNILNSLDGIAK